MIKEKRNHFIIQSHLCVSYPNGEYYHTVNLDEVKQAFEKELEKYGIDYTDIGIIHFVDEDKDIEELIENGIVDYAFELKRKGIINNVGFSSHTASVARKMLDVAPFDVLFFGINPGYDYAPNEDGLIITQERTDLYKECAKRGIVITVMKVYNNGQLLDDRTSPFKQALKKEQCIQYALDRPAVVSCLAGAITVKEMNETLKYYESSFEERDYSFISNLQTKDMEGKCTYCNHCQPCPVGINIGSVNKYYDLAKVGD